MPVDISDCWPKASEIEDQLRRLIVMRNREAGFGIIERVLRNVEPAHMSTDGRLAKAADLVHDHISEFPF